ncbi:MAG: plastocyanin/azurin family copper-binding protein [Acidimicrobiales bacterium]
MAHPTATMARSAGRLPATIFVALVLAGCGSDGGDGGRDGDAGAAVATNTVDIRNFAFGPQVIEVAAGTTVTWTNADDFAHTVRDAGNLFPEPPDIVKGGQPFRHTYDRPGTFNYICGIHNSMTGTVIVK